MAKERDVHSLLNKWERHRAAASDHAGRPQPSQFRLIKTAVITYDNSVNDANG